MLSILWITVAEKALSHQTDVVDTQSTDPCAPLSVPPTDTFLNYDRGALQPLHPRVLWSATLTKR